ncbi:TIGR01841 family phasin [Paraburkholderia youngii]|uniref:TIGR01841 family phasin n=1 Tax=Paraburkholderia youngii TaxID=2782701 RepID=UPI003D1CEF85
MMASTSTTNTANPISTDSTTNLTGTTSIFGEYAKLIGQFKLPVLDVNAILESRSKDIDAIAEAHTTALAGVRSLAQKQLDIVRTTLGAVQALFAPATQPGEQPLASRGENVRQTLHKALVEVKDLADTAYRAQSDTLAVVTKRAAEDVEELKARLLPKKK